MVLDFNTKGHFCKIKITPIQLGHSNNKNYDYGSKEMAILQISTFICVRRHKF